MKTYTFYSDPGHGWVKVSKKDLKKMNISDKISSCSFEKGEWAYLEEDSDAYVWWEAYKDIYECKPTIKIVTSNKLSRIRNYNYYRS